jgi:hypothetical protein
MALAAFVQAHPPAVALPVVVSARMPIAALTRAKEYAMRPSRNPMTVETTPPSPRIDESRE